MELYRHFHNHHGISQAFRGYSVFAPNTNVGACKHIQINGEKQMLTGVSRPSDRTLAVTASMDSGKTVGEVNNNGAESKTTTSNQPGKLQSTDKTPMPQSQFECNNNVRTTETTFRGDLAYPNPTMCKINPATTQSPISHSTMCRNSTVSNVPNIGRMRNDPSRSEAYNNHPTSIHLNQGMFYRLILSYYHWYCSGENPCYDGMSFLYLMISIESRKKNVLGIARQRHYDPRFNPYGNAQAARAYNLYLNHLHDTYTTRVERIVGLNFAEKETINADRPELRTFQDHQTSDRANDFLLFASSQKPHTCDISIVNNPTPSI